MAISTCFILRYPKKNENFRPIQERIISTDFDWSEEDTVYCTMFLCAFFWCCNFFFTNELFIIKWHIQLFYRWMLNSTRCVCVSIVLSLNCILCWIVCICEQERKIFNYNHASCHETNNRLKSNTHCVLVQQEIWLPLSIFWKRTLTSMVSVSSKL